MLEVCPPVVQLTCEYAITQRYSSTNYLLGLYIGSLLMFQGLLCFMYLTQLIEQWEEHWTAKQYMNNVKHCLYTIKI